MEQIEKLCWPCPVYEYSSVFNTDRVLPSTEQTTDVDVDELIDRCIAMNLGEV